ncbi:hypothetical protein ACFE04_020574 [Oxalis oulophora]
MTIAYATRPHEQYQTNIGQGLDMFVGFSLIVTSPSHERPTTTPCSKAPFGLRTTSKCASRPSPRGNLRKRITFEKICNTARCVKNTICQRIQRLPLLAHGEQNRAKSVAVTPGKMGKKTETKYEPSQGKDENKKHL